MLAECLMNVCQRKSSMENYKSENAPMVVRRSDTRTPSKPPLKTSIYQMSHGNEQIAQDRAKCRGLIKMGAGEYEAKRTSESEQKRTQRKARAEASPEHFLPQTPRSICNRQFRVEIGSISRLRTHNNASRI